MKNSINYLTNLMDFIVMQRTSFCWFLAEGLETELSWFCFIYNHKHSLECKIFGEEFKLVKPVHSSRIIKKLEGDYRTELVIPVEMRQKKEDKIIGKRQFLILSLPLMSIYSTFILNGCERVVVSQIIRSPGIYFENQLIPKKFPKIKKKFSTEIKKLASFLPSSEAFISDSYLFFGRLIEDKFSNSKKNITSESVFDNINIYSYSLRQLKKKETNISRICLKIFKFYTIILKENQPFHKQLLTLLIIKWLKKNVSIQDHILKYGSVIFLLDYLKLLLKFRFKYNLIKKKLNKLNITKQFYSTYISALISTQKLIEIELNKHVVFIFSNFVNWTSKIFFGVDNNLLNSLKTKKLKLKTIIYFSTNLKDKFKMAYGASISTGMFEPLERIIYNIEEVVKEEERPHKYMVRKTQLLLFHEEHQITSLYTSKYERIKKKLINATLIPEFGSWIHFKFHEQKKLRFPNDPVKYKREDLVIQLDRIRSNWVLFFLKSIGFDDLSIYKNLEHSDFFYLNKPWILYNNTFNKPSLLFNFYSSSISEFSKIFSPVYYSLGKFGRIHLNKKLNLNLSQRLQTITYKDIFAIIDKLISLTVSITLKDDIDHLKNKRVRPNGELLKNLFRVGFHRLKRKFMNKKFVFLDTNILNSIIYEFFVSSQLSQYLDQTNPLSSLTHRRRISGLGPGGLDRERVSFSIREIHPSHYGRICPIETPEGKNVGLVSSLTTCARINKFGFLETPFWRVRNGKILKIGKPIYLTAEIEDLYKIAPADIMVTPTNYIIQKYISTRYRQDFLTVSPSEIDFISISHVQVVSLATALIPFFEHNDANRSLMGSNMQRQAVPLLAPQKPIVGTGFENQIAIDSAMSIHAEHSGIIEEVDANKIVIKIKNGKKVSYILQKYIRSNQKTCINQRPIVWVGEIVESGQMLTDGPSLCNNELSLGQNILVSYMPWDGYNFEDAILINERLIYDNIFSSIHIERYKIEFDELDEEMEELTKNIPDLEPSELTNLNKDGIVKVGTYLRPNDILVGKIIKNPPPIQLPESNLLRAIFGEDSDLIQDNSYRMHNGCHGRVIETFLFLNKYKIFIEEENKDIEIAKLAKIYIFIAEIKRIQVGDKIAGRHGNKGIISRILNRQDMPFLPDGTPVDMVLNPLGVPSRMNVGQLYECLLGLVGQKLNCRFKILPFDESYGLEISRILINKKLRQVSVFKNQSWLFNPYVPGKMVLIDGRTGQEFENPITVGTAYMLKLIHLVDDKMHSRAVGPYSLITQQPLRGKAHQGGQRFGEMEVWALEGFGAAFTLRELLTIKSDDIEGRNEIVYAIVTDTEISNLGVPESFKVLFQELRSIGLDIKTYGVARFSDSNNSSLEVNLNKKYNAGDKFYDSDYKININDKLF